MAILTLSDERHRELGHSRRNTWKAIAVCAALRTTGAAFGLGLVQPIPARAAPPRPATCTISMHFNNKGDLP